MKAIRQEIFDNYEEFLSIVNHSDFKKHFNVIDAEKLKTRPKGFPADFEGIEHLKFKHYTVLKSYKGDEFFKPDFLNEIREVFVALNPFNRFLNYAINNI